MQLHQQVPLDIIYEIRGRLSPKSLVRFRCISKAWNDITHDLDLARKQLQRSGKIRDPQLLCLINFHSKKGRTIISKISKQIIEINIPFNSCFNATYCNGWHCFGHFYTVMRSDAPILMHNPLRQETLELPQISGFTTEDGFAWYGLGFDARNNLFKLTCLFVSQRSTAEFYILRQKQFWEKLDLPSYLRNCIHLVCKTVFLNGSIHYVVQWVDSCISTILAFDVEREHFRLIDLPHRFRFRDKLMELGGVLAAYLFESTLTNLEELYVLKDCAKGEWGAPLRIPVPEKNIKEEMGGVMRSWGTQVLFCLHAHHLTYQYLAYDFQTGKFTKIDLSQQLACSASSTCYIDFYGHQLSLVPLNM